MESFNLTIEEDVENLVEPLLIDISIRSRTSLKKNKKEIIKFLELVIEKLKG